MNVQYYVAYYKGKGFKKADGVFSMEPREAERLDTPFNFSPDLYCVRITQPEYATHAPLKFDRYIGKSGYGHYVARCPRCKIESKVARSRELAAKQVLATKKCAPDMYSTAIYFKEGQHGPDTSNVELNKPSFPRVSPDKVELNKVAPDKAEQNKAEEIPPHVSPDKVERNKVEEIPPHVRRRPFIHFGRRL